jgi:hypothetical protein
MLLYNDPTLIDHHLAIVSLRDPTPLSLILREVPSMFHSFWGRFTCDITPGGWYTTFWGLVTVAGIGGIIASWSRLDAVKKAVVIFLGLWFVLVFCGWFRWNLSASGVQGRLLFPATASVSVLVATGLVRWIGRRKWPVFGLLICWCIVALWAIFGFIQPTFAPPLRHQDSGNLAIESPMNGTFGERIELLGYDLPIQSVEPGSELDITIYLRALEPLTDTYSMGLWLVSAVPGDTTRLAGLDTWPGDGNYPTTVWCAGEVIEDSYRIAIPEDVSRTQAWLVQLNVYRMDDGHWLEYAENDQPLGQRVILGMVRIGASLPFDVPTGAEIGDAAAFGDLISLRGAQINVDEQHSEAHITLWWRVLEELEQDLTVFVHVVDSEGQLIRTGDGLPLGGGFPTSMWQSGDGIEDEHIVLLPEEIKSGEYTVYVGWYDPISGARLPVGASDSFMLPETLDIQ